MSEVPESGSLPEGTEWPKSWTDFPADFISRSIAGTKELSLPSTPSLPEGLSVGIRKLPGFLQEQKSRFDVYEDVFFKKMKEGVLMTVYEHPAAACGAALAAGLILLRGPRRLLYRNTFGRFQSEESLLIKAETATTNLDLALKQMKNESRKLRERADFAENAMLGGRNKIRDSSKQIQRLATDFRREESRLTDFMEELRELPGRDALKLRAEVASLAESTRLQRSLLEKRITRFSELGISV